MKGKVILFLIFHLLFIRAQTEAIRKNFVSTDDVFGTRVFIQNKGQFNNSIPDSDNICYAYENGAEKIYFTNKGLIYKLTETISLNKEELKKREHCKSETYKSTKTYFIKMSWLNANPDIQIEQSRKQNHYFTYGSKELNASTLKKIIYRNVYDGIDIEYSIPEDKEYGIKYNVIIYPGANPNDIKIVYSGDINKIIKDASGNIVIKTPLEEITEHAPNSFYESKESLSSEFTLSNNIIGFIFPKGYQNNKTVVIDPWVTNITSIVNNNYGYDVDYDYAGNLFIYGGNSSIGGPYMIAKYNSFGTLLWTFGGTVASIWDSQGPIGNFAVNKFTGKCYMGNLNNSAPYGRIIRLDQNGIYDNFITPGSTTWGEVWDITFDCNSGNIFGLGGSTTSNQSGSIINQITGSVAPVNLTGFGSTQQDIVSGTIDDSGNVFIIYASVWFSAINNNIARVNSAFTNTVWGLPSTYTAMSELGNKQAYVGSGFAFASGSGGFNCLAVNGNYVFYYDGFNLAAYNKVTGSKTGSIVIPGNVLMEQGGIAVDDCNNVYIGGNTKIDIYNFNGASFNIVASIPLNVVTTNKYVYDMKLDKTNDLLYVCGSGFCGVYSAISSLSCAPTNTCSGVGVAQSIGQNDLENKVLHLFPNPNNGSFQLQVENFINNGELILLNCLGQKVHQQRINYGMNNIRTNVLSKGMYNYILFENNQKLFSGKLLIE